MSENNNLKMYVTSGCRSNGSDDPEAHGAMALYFRDQLKNMTRDNLVEILPTGNLGRIGESEGQPVVDQIKFLEATTNHQAEYHALITAVRYLAYVANRNQRAWDKLTSLEIATSSQLIARQLKMVIPDQVVADDMSPYNTRDKQLSELQEELLQHLNRLPGDPKIVYEPDVDENIPSCLW